MAQLARFRPARPRLEPGRHPVGRLRARHRLRRRLRGPLAAVQRRGRAARAGPRDHDRVHPPRDQRPRPAARGRARLWVFRDAAERPPRAPRGRGVVSSSCTEARSAPAWSCSSSSPRTTRWRAPSFMAGHLANTFAPARRARPRRPLVRDRRRAPAPRRPWRAAAGPRGRARSASSSSARAARWPRSATRSTPRSRSLGGLAQDLSATAHFLVRLRIAHPILALAGALLVAFAASRVLQATRRRRAPGAPPGPCRRSPCCSSRRAAEPGAARAGLDADRPPAAGRPAVDRLRPARGAGAVAAPARAGEGWGPGASCLRAPSPAATVGYFFGSTTVISLRRTGSRS